MISDTQRLQLYERAAKCYQATDKANWRFAAWAACSGGTYRDLAAYIGGISEDKVRTHAHAWGMYRDLWREYGGIVTHMRRMPYIYLSHFFALHRIRQKYGLPLSKLMEYLTDVFQDEGGISSDDLMTQADREHGAERALPYEAGRAEKAMRALLTRGDLATHDRHLFVQTLARLEELSG